ncbi:GerAB/ArcD/ProY family transporter [Clostridium thermarum]|uniref:GerAB/ArcD/ProY family transporter n=1 Tax=Clostridium thermarum TaxID=1716543 RepID=UPI0011202A37|nr:endospore germination permease [Clostridium thermarum]
MENINLFHLMFLIWGTSIVSMKTNITTLLSLAGRDTWIAVGIASVIALFYLIYVTNVMQKTNNYDIAHIYRKALGNTLGNILIVYSLLNLILTLIECASVEASAMHINLFIETPQWYLILFFVIPAIYSVKKGLSPIVNISIIGVCFAIFAGINLVMLTAPYKNYKFLLPIMADNLNTQFIFAIISTLGYYGSIFLVFPFFKFVSNKNKLTRYSIIGFFFVMQMHIVSSVGTIAAFGPTRAANLIFPKLVQTQEIRLFGFLESGELFVLFQIIGGWFVKYVITFFVIREFLRSFNADGNFFIYSITGLVIAASYFISREFKILYNALYIHSYLNFAGFICVPLIVFTIFKIKNSKSN